MNDNNHYISKLIYIYNIKEVCLPTNVYLEVLLLLIGQINQSKRENNSKASK